MRTIALIPARGGSKRIPRKNIADFCGRPMIAWPIRAAQDTGLFDQIIVSTDDEEIANVAAQAGAEVPFRRPAELASDHANTDVVIQHTLDWLEKRDSLPEYCCCIYPTSPMLEPDFLKRGFETLRHHNAATAISVTEFDFPILRAFKMNSDTRLEAAWPEHFIRRSQDLPQFLHDAGQFYWLDVSKYRSVGALLTDNTVPVPLPKTSVQDIDTPEDLKIALQLMERRLSQREGKS